MNPRDQQRLSPAWVALIFGLLLVAWLVFALYPQPTRPDPRAAPVVTESKLRAVGLDDNPDWDGLPEFFALVADEAEWKQDRTRFAYWHPVMKTYTYYFEATRNASGIRFKEIAEPQEPDHYWDEDMAEGSMISFYFSVPVPVQPQSSTMVVPAPGSRDHQVKIDLDKIPSGIPPTEQIVIPAINP